jgi:hypothetical protein
MEARDQCRGGFRQYRAGFAVTFLCRRVKVTRVQFVLRCGPGCQPGRRPGFREPACGEVEHPAGGELLQAAAAAARALRAIEDYHHVTEIPGRTAAQRQPARGDDGTSDARPHGEQDTRAMS